MKKGNRVLAMFLAAVMLVTSIAWDFGETKAEETTSAIIPTDDGVSINFDNIDVAELDANGYVSTKFNNSNKSVIPGEVNQAVSKHWFSGDADAIPYGNDGFKTKDISTDVTTDKTTTVMYTPYSYEDFQISAEIYYGAWSGIVLGETNVYPSEDDTSSSVALYFNQGRIHVRGAIDNSTVTLMRGKKPANTNNDYSTNGRSTIFNTGSGDTIKASTGTAYKVNVKKTGNHLLVWISGEVGVMSVKLRDSYKTGHIGIQSEYYDSDGGGFKSLNVKKVGAVETHVLKDMTMQEIDDSGYSASISTTLNLNSVGDAFFSGSSALEYNSTTATITSKNDGLKGRGGSKGVIAGLNIPYIYENFRLEAEMYHGQVTGISIGAKSAYPFASKSTMTTDMINLYFNSAVMEACGAIQATSQAVIKSGYSSASTVGNGMYKLTTKDTNDKAYAGTKDAIVTLIVEVRDGMFTMGMKGYNGYVSIPVANGFKPEKISLISRHKSTDQGGIISYTITNLDAGDKADFDNVNLNNLDAAGYTATKHNASGVVTGTKGTVSNYWFSGQSGYASGVSVDAKNNGLKPKETQTSLSTLNLPHRYNNFRLKAKTYQGQVVGVALTSEAAGPWSSSAISVYFNQAMLEVRGAVKNETRTVEGAQKTEVNAGLYQLTPTGSTFTTGQERTIVVEYYDGILSIWLEGFKGVARLQVADTFTVNNITLFARRYSGNGGGLKGYEIEKLPDNYNVGATVDLEDHTEFANVNIAKLEEKGFTSTRFDFSDYSVSGDEDQAVSNHWFAGELDMASTGVVATSTNQGLKPNTPVGSSFTVLNTPYTAEAGYENYHVSTEVYGGTSAGIVLGEKNTCPSSTSNTVRIYFHQDKVNNANQIQVYGGGIDPNTAVVSGGATWSAVYAPTYIFKPATDFVINDDEIYKLNVEVQNGTLTIWVDGYDGVLSLNTKKTFVNDGIALGAEYYVSSGLKSLTVKKLSEDIVLPYTAEEFATYRSKEGHTAPTYKHYLFAGWYTDAACNDYTKAVPYNALTTNTETVYAKFVPRYVMTVKAQISAELLDDNLKNDTTGQIRFATTVDSKNYSLAGFKVSYVKDGTPKDVYSTSKTVWTELTAIGDQTYEPQDFCQISEYFKTCVVKPFADTYFDMEFEVTPCWRTLDGTYVYGDTVVKTVNQGINTEALDGKTALLLGDSIQAGGNFKGEGHTLLGWYQRLEQYYGMDADGVGQKGWALTNQKTSGRLQIINQFDYAEQGKEYDFVILEGGVNDVRIDQDTQNPDIKIDWGTINEDATATFTDDNIAGAMQELIVTAKEKYPNAEIVYIINHHFGATEANMEKYVAMVKAACRVHDISYVDLSDVDAYPSLAPLTKQSAEYIPDNLHPNAAGYELSTPVIANHLRKLLTGEFTKTVYVASTGKDAKGYGTEAEPYQSLNYAMSKVADDGTVYVEDTLTCVNANSTTSFSMGGYGVETGKNIESKTNIIDKVNHKQVTIAGASDTAKLEFPVDGTTYLLLNDSVILKDIQVQWPSRIFAEGNTFIIEDSVTQVGSKEPMLVGGSSYHNVDKTDLRIYAGIYSKIVGGQLGGSQKDTVGETNVIVGGKVNEGVDITTHDHTRILLGGNYSEGGNCTVTGDTNVIVEQGARFDYVFGAGAKAEGIGDTIVCAVQGDTNVTFAGEAYGVYGGACGRLGTNKVDTKVTCVNTNVTILEGAKAEQVFGGSEHASISGNANVNLLGGTIDRRVWGGCYNEEEPATYYANGTVTVTISPDVTLDTWHGMAAVSRFSKTSSSTETGIFIFTDYTNNSTNIGKISSSAFDEADKTHDHLVKVGANGSVKVVDGKLVVTPNSGYAATVTGATANADGTYTMTAAEVVVTFN